MHAKTYRQSKHEKNIPETDLQGICKPVEIIGHLFFPEDEPKILDALKYVWWCLCFRKAMLQAVGRKF